MEGIQFKYLRITRPSSRFSFLWQQPGEITYTPEGPVDDLKAGVEKWMHTSTDPFGGGNSKAIRGGR